MFFLQEKVSGIRCRVSGIRKKILPQHLAPDTRHPL